MVSSTEWGNFHWYKCLRSQRIKRLSAVALGQLCLRVLRLLGFPCIGRPCTRFSNLFVWLNFFCLCRNIGLGFHFVPGHHNSAQIHRRDPLSLVCSVVGSRGWWDVWPWWPSVQLKTRWSVQLGGSIPLSQKHGILNEVRLSIKLWLVAYCVMAMDSQSTDREQRYKYLNYGCSLNLLDTMCTLL